MNLLGIILPLATRRGTHSFLCSPPTPRQPYIRGDLGIPIQLHKLYQEQGDYDQSRFETEGKTATCSNAKKFYYNKKKTSGSFQKFITAIEIKWNYSQIAFAKAIVNTEHLRTVHYTL